MRDVWLTLQYTFRNCAMLSANIVATFIGKNGSMGFRTGKEYQLWLFEKNGKYYISRRSENAVAIPYDTMNAVKKNWKL